MLTTTVPTVVSISAFYLVHPRFDPSHLLNIFHCLCEKTKIEEKDTSKGPFHITTALILYLSHYSLSIT